MEREIREQATVLAKNVAKYRRAACDQLAGLKPRGVLLIARGSSDNASLLARYLIETHLMIPVSLAAPSVLTRYGAEVDYSGFLGIGVSQSGAGPDVAEMLSLVRSQGGATLAITNVSDSPVARAAEAVILLEAGHEESVAATKTYTASLAALYEAIRALGAGLPEPRTPDEGWIEDCRIRAKAAIPTLLQSQVLISVGRGYRYATACETALKLIECALLPCKSYSTADFVHGPLALARAGSCVVTFGEPVTGTDSAVVEAPDVGDAPDSPLLDIVFGQWLALFAALARCLDPDAPPRLTKVTRTY